MSDVLDRLTEELARTEAAVRELRIRLQVEEAKLELMRRLAHGSQATATTQRANLQAIGDSKMKRVSTSSQVIDVLKSAGPEGATAKDVQRALCATFGEDSARYTLGNIRSILCRLHKASVLHRTRAGVYALPTEVTSTPERR